MKKFEYLQISTDSFAFTWNDLGREGWELVAVSNSYGYFKRELDEDE